MRAGCGCGCGVEVRVGGGGAGRWRRLLGEGGGGRAHEPRHARGARCGEVRRGGKWRSEGGEAESGGVERG